MWTVLNHSNKHFLLYCLCEDNVIILKLTNLTKFWSSTKSCKETIKLFQDQNPLVEASEDSLSVHVLNILDIHKSKVGIVFKEDIDGISVKFSSSFQGIPFSLVVNLELMDTALLFSEILVPLLMSLQVLQSQRQQLCELLKKKDTEIAEYKLEGFQLTRKNVETAKFHESIFSEMPPLADISEPSQLFNVIPQSKIFEEVSKLLKQERKSTSSNLSPNISSSNKVPNHTGSRQNSFKQADEDKPLYDDEIDESPVVEQNLKRTSGNTSQTSKNAIQTIKKKKLNL